MTAKPRTARKSLKIILDSNALLTPLQFKIDIFEELKKLLNRNFELILLSPIRQELLRMANQGSPKTRKDATYALKLAGKYRLLDTEKGEEASTDDLIMEIATKRRWAVFTNDRQLRSRLRNINVPVIYVRQKSRLEIDGRL